MNVPFPDRDHGLLERRLRAGAPAFAPAPPAALRGRILAALHGSAPVASAPRAGRLGTLISIAAALLVLCSAWWLTHQSVRPSRPADRPADVVAFSRELFGAGTRVLALPGRAEVNLRLEAENLLADTTRVAEGLVRGLPAPLRTKLARM